MGLFLKFWAYFRVFTVKVFMIKKPTPPRKNFIKASQSKKYFTTTQKKKRIHLRHFHNEK
jgi:hypothetical protein